MFNAAVSDARAAASAEATARSARITRFLAVRSNRERADAIAAS
jgi:hypothetical protein|tara:strand:+ start:2262 stop:2393 length:132 start_codon:yes stop_codon:yes gene_type:complete